MKVQYIADMLSEKLAVDTILVVATSELRAFASKPGEYLWLRLRDRTGEIEAKMWEGSPALASRLSPGTPVRVRGSVSRWRDRYEIVLEMVEPCEAGEVDPGDFLPLCPRPVEEMWSELEGFIALVDDGDLLRLLEAFKGDEDTKQAFCRAPASRGWHHGYLGGLLEHTVGVTRLCLTVSESLPEVNRSFLIAGAILHDLGKMDDYRCDTIIDYEPSGRFIGHIVSGYRRLHGLARGLGDFPEDKLRLLGHIIVSHHRKAEWGSPQKPKTLEAQVVHYADNMDAQVNGFSKVLQDGRAKGVEWTRYHPLLESEVYCAT